MLTQTKQTKRRTPQHACFFYDSKQSRQTVLAGYFKEGLDNNELCIFVTPETPRQVVKAFKAEGFDPSAAIAKGAFRIFDMGSSYLPQGQFVADYMLQNVKVFMEDAKTSGYSGLRTAGEMSWLYKVSEFNEEAKQYESDVNTLTTPESNFTGICLYPTEDSSTKIVVDAMHTHPGFIYDGNIRANPHYQPAH